MGCAVSRLRSALDGLLQPSEQVRVAANGETVLATDQDKVVAELVPPGPGKGP
jgi:antitoxin (DNA-binding transcriptional repressor) of toxin-antitoxin stability system